MQSWYSIQSPVHGDYLAKTSVVAYGAVVNEWGPRPEKALRFANESDARFIVKINALQGKIVRCNLRGRRIQVLPA